MLGGELLFLGQKPSLNPCSSLLVLTDALENPLGLVLPPDSEEVNRDPTEDDCKANGTFLRRHPEGNSDEKQAGQDEENGQADVYLNTDPKSRLQAAPGEQGTLPSKLCLAPIARVLSREGRRSCGTTDPCVDDSPACPSPLNKGTTTLTCHGGGTDLGSALHLILEKTDVGEHLTRTLKTAKQSTELWLAKSHEPFSAPCF